MFKDNLTRLLPGVAVCLLVAPIVAQSPDTQSPQARFKSDADLVQVDVVALDKKHHPVHGLTVEDFHLLVDGKPQAIEAFTEISLPANTGVAASWTRDVPPDVASNQSVNQEGRIVIIFMDRSIPVGEPTLTARRIAAAIVNQLGPNDLGAVVSSSGGGVQNLTADRSRLLRAVSRSELSTDTSEDAHEITDGMLAQVNPNNPLLSPLNDGRCMCGVCVLNAITGVADALRNTPRRRKLLFFVGNDLRVQSGGVGSLGAVLADGGCETPLKDARTAMFAALARANVTVHSLDPSGLVNVSPVTRTSSPLRGARVQEAITSNMTSFLEHQNALRLLPDLTGGRTIVNTNAPGDLVPEIFRESDGYYLLGFRASGNVGTPGQHTIAVTVKRDDLRVHFRNAYTVAAAAERSADDTLPASLRSALEPLLPAASVPLEVQAATFAVPGTSRAAVMLVVGLAASTKADRRQADAPFDLFALAVDQGGRPKALNRSSLDLVVAGDAEPRRHADVFSGLELSPGDYEIRVAGGNGARSGSVFTHVTVPAFRSEALSLSGILLGEMKSAQAQQQDLVAGLTFPVVPTARREFQGQRVNAFVRIYQGTGRTDPLQPVTLRTFLVDSQGRTVSSGSTVIAETRFNRDRASDHLVALPISRLAPGDYLLRIEAAMGKRTAGRAVRFSVARP